MSRDDDAFTGEVSRGPDMTAPLTLLSPGSARDVKLEDGEADKTTTVADDGNDLPTELLLLSKSMTSSMGAVRTSKYLEYWSLRIIHDTCNTKQFGTPAMKRMANNFSVIRQSVYTCSSLLEYIAQMKYYVTVTPNLHIDFMNWSSEVDEWRGKATVFVFHITSGVSEYRNALERESMAVMNWTRKRSGWKCTRYCGLHGPACFASDVPTAPS